MEDKKRIPQHLQFDGKTFDYESTEHGLLCYIKDAVDEEDKDEVIIVEDWPANPEDDRFYVLFWFIGFIESGILSMNIDKDKRIAKPIYDE